MTRTKLYVATPCAHDIVNANYAATVYNIAKALTLKGVDSEIQLMSASDLEFSRSALASWVFANQSYTHILFIDSDMSFQPSLILRMLAFDKDFVSALYPKRQLNWSRLVKYASETPNQDVTALVGRSLDYVGVLRSERASEIGHETDIEVESGFAKAEHTGMGVCLVKRQVLEEMVARGAALSPDAKPQASLPWPVTYYGFFHKEPWGNGGYFGEDISFCRRWTVGCEGTIWACIDEKLDHHGVLGFSGSFIDRLQRVAN